MIAGFGSLLVLYLLLNQQAGAGKPEVTSTAEEIEFSGSIFVHVVGEVKEPGLYELNLGARVSDAIEVAGGFTQDAVQSSVNLARNLSDGEQVIIASEDQFQSSSAGGGLV